MKHFFMNFKFCKTAAFWCGFAILTASVVFSSSASFADELRILSYNIRNGRGLKAPDVDLERPAGVIRKLNPDVIGLQELDWKSERAAKRDIPKEMGELVGMKSFFAPAIDFQGGKYGVASLTKTAPIRTYNLPLPGKEECRTLQVTEFEDFVFFNTHFSLTAEDRLASVKIIGEEMKKFSKPIFLCGDFNATPDSEVIQALKKEWKAIGPDAPTYPANQPEIQIDYVFTQKGTSVKVKEAQVISAPNESDHAPVLVVVEF